MKFCILIEFFVRKNTLAVPLPMRTTRWRREVHQRSPTFSDSINSMNVMLLGPSNASLSQIWMCTAAADASTNQSLHDVNFIVRARKVRLRISLMFPHLKVCACGMRPRYFCGPSYCLNAGNKFPLQELIWDNVKELNVASTPGHRLAAHSGCQVEDATRTNKLTLAEAQSCSGEHLLRNPSPLKASPSIKCINWRFISPLFTLKENDETFQRCHLIKAPR